MEHYEYPPKIPKDYSEICYYSTDELLSFEYLTWLHLADS